MKKIKNRYLKIDNVEVIIYTIGNFLNGESNVFLLLINGKVEYSMIIDCCGNDIELIRENIINKYNIDSFNIICWTHPHDDHSRGMLHLLKKYSDAETKIIFPSEIEIVSECMNSIAKKIYQYGISITKRNNIQKGICINATQNTEIDTIIFSQNDGPNKYKISIKSLSPIAHRIYNLKNNCKHEYNEKCNHNYNEYSVVLLVELNNIGFLFGADAENASIEEIGNEECLDNVVYTKIPHHGSVTSDKLIELLIGDDNVQKICTTTALMKKNKYGILPNNSILDQYQKHFKNVFCTSQSYLNQVPQKISYGIIKSKFKIPLYSKEKNIYASVSLEGEAVSYDSKNSKIV